MLHGKEVDCAKLFKPVPTDTGICCAFNNKNVLRDSEYSRLLKRKQKNDDVEEEEEEQIHGAEIGVKKGLKVFVDQHSNRITAGSVLSTSKLVWIHPLLSVRIHLDHCFQSVQGVDRSSRGHSEQLWRQSDAAASRA